MKTKKLLNKIHPVTLTSKTDLVKELLAMLQHCFKQQKLIPVAVTPDKKI